MDQRMRDQFIFILLVAIGIVGRWGQPDWAVTPVAAIGLLAGCYFRQAWVAMLVPLSAMLITDLLLPGYHAFAVMVAVYLSMAAPPLLGRLLRRGSGPTWAAKLGAVSLAPATFFFLITNLAVWAWSSQPYYEKSVAGLMACYAQALPFYRKMLLGDLAFTAILFGAAIIAGALTTVPGRARSV